MKRKVNNKLLGQEGLNIINLTPHELNFMDGRNEVIFTLPGAGANAARAQAQKELVCQLNGLNVVYSTYGAVNNLPEPKEGTIYIVSAIVAQALASNGEYREDVFIVEDTVRDEAGRIIGCRALGKIL